MLLSFREYLEFNYLSIGHNFEGNFDSWILKPGSDNIVLSRRGEYFHDDYSSKRLDFKGRIDHDKNMISITQGHGDQERLEYLLSVLESEYPNYEIWYFGYGRPRKLGAS